MRQEPNNKEVDIPHILFVDDSRANNFIIDMQIRLDHVLAIPHFEMNAFAALDYLERLRGTDIFPQFIFVDINMPLKDGFEFVEDFTNNFPEYLLDTQIHILSTSFRKIDKQKASNLKVIKSYIEKPLSTSYLSSILQKDKYC